MSHWTSKPTGDMTLSVLDGHGHQILKVDMLACGTMKAGTNGDLLARTLNDLALVASLPALVESNGTTLSLPYPDAGLSPLPWSVDYDDAKRLLVVRDANRRRIAEKKYPASFPASEIESIVLTLRSGLSQTPVKGAERN